MASTSNLALVPLVFFLLVGCVTAQLTPNYYSLTCPNLLLTVRTVTKAAILKERRMGASILRLFFHDCFVNGCDASLLLDDTANFTGEKSALPNINSVRGFNVIDNIKTAVEKDCPRIVSCADILALAARDSVVTLGGLNWDVPLGRRDSTTASLIDANNDIPSPTSDLDEIIPKFSKWGLSMTDMVTLVGAHTVGFARCTNFRSHLYNDTNIDPLFAQLIQSNCPAITGSGDDNLAPLDLQTPNVFDNNYYNNLVSQKGLLHSDQELYNNKSTASQVQTYSTDLKQFLSDFAAAMIKMGNISPLTGTQGEIRLNCRVIN